MSDAALSALKLCFLALLYLFLARLIRTVWVEIRETGQTGTGTGQALKGRGAATAATATATAANSRGAGTSAGPATDAGARAAGMTNGAAGMTNGAAGRFSRGRRRATAPVHLKIVEPPEISGTRFVMLDEMTVGRGKGCAVYVDDTFASQLHARIFRRETTMFVEDLGSTNGTYLNRKKVHGPVPLHAGDRLQVGHTVLEVER